MRSSKSRSRSKANRPRTMGNIINRVFDSSGPEGKVRGTPQQIIEKYLVLARDAQLSNDRVAAENFLQHAEHYTRMLGEAQREMAAEQEARQQQHQQNSHGNGHRDRRDDRREDDRGADRGHDRGEGEQPYLADPVVIDAVDEDAGLVETPEARHDRRDRRPAPRRPVVDGPAGDEPAQADATGDAPADAASRRDRTPRDQGRKDDSEKGEGRKDEGQKGEGQKDRRPRGPRRPRADKEGGGGDGGDSSGDGGSREAAE
ncbi:DUF4167 domain-containing protein [Aliigemmobacter aestuarii]|uniref:DUF4167 domain-containing protein n=1 Tax=Aliigemmobacter aestuarii TaxID=1445661 RepID=A0A4V3V093_9RHOB|nr:DUF4167 domain-containing protein [Gemmobacter aestuarii]THD82960.1 DUF4167 domain-containing protein [Gemmobacter aestuarii]